MNTSLYALSSAVPADDIPDKSAWSRFGRLKGARRVYAMEGVHQYSLPNLLERTVRTAIQLKTIKSLCFVVVALLLATSSSGLFARDGYETERREMIAAIRETVDETRSYTGIDALDEQVMQAVAAVPRHEFVPRDLRFAAYLNSALPIGEGQTISQPYIVALMTHLMEVDGDSVVLEIGTGSGYQAAVLARLVRHVYTIEIIETLGRRAENTLARLGFDNVTVKIGDGYIGWEEHAPFDAIIVTAAPEQVPQPLIDQLKPGARMVVPVGPAFGYQTLQVLEKQQNGDIRETDILPVGFVPFTGEGERTMEIQGSE